MTKTGHLIGASNYRFLCFDFRSSPLYWIGNGGNNRIKVVALPY